VVVGMVGDLMGERFLVKVVDGAVAGRCLAPVVVVGAVPQVVLGKLKEVAIVELFLLLPACFRRYKIGIWPLSTHEPFSRLPGSSTGSSL
jgi:hypothetical protein